MTIAAVAPITVADMRIDRLLGLGRPTISFEFFPPKSDAGFAQLYQAVGELHAIRPSYVSVTYGAGGSTRQKTVGLVERIQRELNAHCGGPRRNDDVTILCIDRLTSPAFVA